MPLKPYEVIVLYAEHCILKLNEVFLPLIYAFRTISAQSSVRRSLYIDAKSSFYTLHLRFTKLTS